MFPWERFPRGTLGTRGRKTTTTTTSRTRARARHTVVVVVVVARYHTSVVVGGGGGGGDGGEFPGGGIHNPREVESILPYRHRKMVGSGGGERWYATLHLLFLHHRAPRATVSGRCQKATTTRKCTLRCTTCPPTVSPAHQDRVQRVERDIRRTTLCFIEVLSKKRFFFSENRTERFQINFLTLTLKPFINNYPPKYSFSLLSGSEV